MPSLASLDPTAHRPHALHDGARVWPETNCYVDLFIELVGALGLEAEAMFGFTVTQDFEDDQFTFFKVPVDDLEALYGLRVQELAIFDDLAAHVARQVARERVVLVEMDGFHLPDTGGVSYRVQHTKTTVGITSIDPASRRMTYFHNAGFFQLSGEDFDGLFAEAGRGRRADALLPYTEFVKLPTAPVRVDTLAIAKRLMVRHLARRPEANPIAAFGFSLAAHLADLAGRPQDYFHVYAFNTLRQLGANFELLASHLAWFSARGEPGLSRAEAAALEIATGAKTMQFKLARAMARGRFDGLDAFIAPMAASWDTVMAELDARFMAGRVERRAA
ncbi:DUF1839 family protein [Kaistia geumhonensis]|uniref:DUF1839 family protein n=1 Tax=Kaistia geumhonensis TaxID=410839 RepID=A0ABU0M4R7_9HYPH|nr:DUF1839 family protein [Kaistia geumhonensis]MCX5478827.1 DUF1839 family protein [Kaistia geumhonensis]MDQ0515954.1 hypothetical protein [Kaistia geumhonensis]